MQVPKYFKVLSLRLKLVYVTAAGNVTLALRTYFVTIDSIFYNPMLRCNAVIYSTKVLKKLLQFDVR
jgi:hypothetical protein